MKRLSIEIKNSLLTNESGTRTPTHLKRRLMNGLEFLKLWKMIFPPFYSFYQIYGVSMETQRFPMRRRSIDNLIPMKSSNNFVVCWHQINGGLKFHSFSSKTIFPLLTRFSQLISFLFLSPFWLQLLFSFFPFYYSLGTF